MGPPDGSGAGVDFIETECEDERFLPLIQAEASQIDDSLWLGSEDNVRDLVFLKVANITRIVTIMPYAVDPTDCGHLSEALKSWYADNVVALFLEALDTPTALLFEHVERAVAFVAEATTAGRRVIVHCGRGISRSATLVIAVLMVRDGLSYRDAFDAAAAKRACVYPNVGFQLQLCLFETLGRSSDRVRDALAAGEFDISAEIAVSVARTLDNVEDLVEALFEDAALAGDGERWMDFGFFIQNCREYLGHVDVGLPLALLARADDVARRLRNLDRVFAGAGVDVAVRVGRVLSVFHDHQLRVSTADGALPRVDPNYASLLDGPGARSAGRAKRRRT